MTAAAHTVSPDIRRQALAWLVTSWSGEITATERAALEHWRKAANEHEQAWQQVQGLGRAMQEIPPALNPTLRSAPGRNLRRTVLRCLAGLSAAGVAGYTVHESEPWQRMTADLHTAGNQRRDVTLPDGTLVSMNATTVIDLQFDAAERRLLLRRGEIVVTTAHENGPYRPFSVITQQGSVRALGTRFSVRRLDEAGLSRVNVFEGAVEIRPSGNPHSVQVLQAGLGTQFSADAIQGRFDANPTETAWVKGLLVADRMRLDAFLTELGRYRPGMLRCDPAAADLIVSGVYPLADTGLVLEALANALPLRIATMTRYWTTVHLR